MSVLDETETNLAELRRFHLGDLLYLEENLTVTIDGGALAVNNDVLPRTDLPIEDPFYNQRIVKCVLSGMVDCTILDNHCLCPFNL